jgi:predicted dehydrogenase
VVQAVSVNLAIHDLPLVRAALPDWRSVEVRSAQPLVPFGHHQHLTCGDKRIQLLANMHTHRWSEWSTTFAGEAGSLTVNFTPSYVPAGSGAIIIRQPQGDIHIPASDVNGYEAEWRHLHDIVTRGAAPLHSAREALDDLDFALRIGAQAAIKAQEILA